MFYLKEGIEMRIGLFTDQYYPNISGVVTSVKMLYEGLTAMGHECFIFSSFDEKLVETTPELTNKNVINLPGVRYPFKSVKDYRYTFFHTKGLKMIKNCNLDIIHVHTEFGISKYAIKAHRKYKIPMVHTLHTLWTDYFKYLSPYFDKHNHKQMSWILKNMFCGPVSKNSTIEIVPTKKVCEQANEYSLGNNIRIVPTGIELDRFKASNFKKEDVDALKKKYGIVDDQFVFLYIGRTSKEKSITNLIEAYCEACFNNKKTKLLIVGGGPELPELKQLVKDLNIEDQVVFTDLIPWEEIPIYYQLGNVFINASQSETQGLTYLEALASSIPVLVQKDECVEDLIHNYYNGVFFEGQEDLVLKIKELLKAPETLKTIKANTLPSIDDYSKDKFSSNIYHIYQEAKELYNPKNNK